MTFDMRPVVCIAFVAMSIACGGGTPSGPLSDSNDTSGTISVDGQTMDATSLGSLASSRLPGLAWVDLTIGSCSSSDPRINITLKEVSTPPPPGTYAVSEGSDLVSANASVSGQQWSAGNFYLAQYCGGGFGGGVLPACTATSPGSGTVTVGSSSPARIAGSFSFNLVLPSNYQGLLINRPPPTTKLISGTFALEFKSDDRARCP